MTLYEYIDARGRQAPWAAIDCGVAGVLLLRVAALESADASDRGDEHFWCETLDEADDLAAPAVRRRVHSCERSHEIAQFFASHEPH